MNVSGGEGSDENYLVAAQDLSISGEAYYQMVIDEVPEYMEEHEAALNEIYGSVNESEFIWDHDLESGYDEGDDLW